MSGSRRDAETHVPARDVDVAPTLAGYCLVSPDISRILLAFSRQSAP